LNLRLWLFFLVLFLIAGVIVRSTFVVALVTAILVILGVTYWWQKHSLDQVTYRRRFRYTRGFPGEHDQVRIEIENRKFLPLSWLRSQDPWPKQVGPEDESVLAPSHIEDQGFLTNLVSLRWYERTRRSFDLLLRQRGVYKVGPATIESGDLFGIYQQERQEERLDTLTVYPQLLSLRELGFPAEDPFGDRGSLRRLFEDPNRPIGVRDYHPEDGFRRVHWPATARTGSLQVKVYQPVSVQVMAICLNVATFVRHWEGYHPQMLEQLVSLAATLASQGIQEGYQVGLLSNGCLANSDQPFRVPPGRSAQQLPHLLQALAGVTPLVIAPFNEFLLREAPHIPYGAVLMVLTAIVTPELGETLVKLKRHERRISLLSLAQEPPPVLPGIQAVHLPFKG
jgi:uncharacterized protein (DUF58 family)